jgi:hypothetical protein
MDVEIMVECDDRPAFLSREIQNFRVFRTIQPDFTHV